MALDFEKQYYSKEVNYIAGCDEAGRGCLLGPVVAAAVILPKNFSSELINDSKKLTAKKRDTAFDLIMENAVAIGVCIVPPEKIDEINILEASRMAMEEALSKMNHPYDLVLTDCMDLYHIHRPYISLIKGDAKALCIAAASIIAKVTRDRICLELDEKYPEYHIAKNKGYGTKDHLEALDLHGPVKGLHRFSYKPVRDANIKKIKLF